MATESCFDRGWVNIPDSKIVSKYCEECLRFRQKECEGKSASQKSILYFGGRRTGRRLKAGLNFCKRYEFDVRLYKFADGSGQAETIKHVRQRQAVKTEEIFKQEAFDDFDLGAGLSSAELEAML